MITENYLYVNHADETPENANVGAMLSNAGLSFLSNLVAAKKEGEQLPGFLDKLASVAINGQTKAVEIAKEEVKEQATNKMGWIIAAILLLIILLMFFKS